MARSTLKFTTMTIPASDIGPLSPLPDIATAEYTRAPVTADETLLPEESENLYKGVAECILPYRMQNNFERKLSPTALPVAVLENERLVATFYTGFGGRLYSLYDKKEKRELLYKNPVFQPCNLALRTAWFSGGIEWNVSVWGHCPFTCSPLFARCVTADDGEPMLRMYEYERIRGIVYSLTFRLSGDLLLLNVNIENKNDYPVYMYWWSNMSTPQNKDTRIVVPAESTLKTTYKDDSYHLSAFPYPRREDGKDLSYPAHHATALDYFYRVPTESRKWIASVEPDGKGFFEFSDPGLKGRKLFLWGAEKGGPHWNAWLSDGSQEYIEIQAGILRTQMEHFLMKERSTVSFVEAFGAITMPPEVASGEDYKAAQNAAEQWVEGYYHVLEEASFKVAEEGPIERFGSGFGAVEELVRGERISDLVEFPTVNDGESDELLTLVKTGELKEHAPLDPPSFFVTDPRYEKYLLSAKPSWYRSYLLGVFYYSRGDRESALKYYEESLGFAKTPWAYRDIAMIERIHNKNNKAAVEYMERAYELLPDNFNLLVDFARTLIATERYERWLEIYERELPENLKRGRLQMNAALCAAEGDEPERAVRYLTENFLMPDFEEGEFSLFAIWKRAHTRIMERDGIKDPTEEAILEKYPLPFELDFRMR